MPWLRMSLRAGGNQVKNKQTNEEILERAVKQAQSSGFVVDHSGWGYHHIIFSHDFAKAFWGTDKDVEIGTVWVGDELNGDEAPILYGGEIWQHHLQQMVLEPDPIQYLARFLGEEDTP